MRVKVILNPAADNGRAAQLQTGILQAAKPFGQLELVLAQRPRHAEQLAREAAAAGYDLVVAAGGDGTVHEVVNGLMAEGKPVAKLGVIPLGSGNDFAFCSGVAADWPTAVTRLFAGQSKWVDLARIEDENGRAQIFDNNFGIGFDARVVVQTIKITHIHGFLKYFLAVLHSIAFYYDTPQLEMAFDGEPVAQRILFLALGVGPRGGGGFLLTPDARQDDNLIDSCLVNPVGRLIMLQMLLQAVKGTHIYSRHVTMRRSQQITIRLVEPAPIHIDGEMFAFTEDKLRQVTITSMPAAIEVVY
ncbi:MAG: diacylglycerol kinase family lipid kinase [Chloroflexi bacterium]|nr:diacylglycerol kinase family lipid kinase [Chloroflexota bacterium]MBP7045104.1 diacylglycerol kinase family lipid kinase [Chloroflexota bacterium]